MLFMSNMWTSSIVESLIFFRDAEQKKDKQPRETVDDCSDLEMLQKQDLKWENKLSNTLFIVSLPLAKRVRIEHTTPNFFSLPKGPENHHRSPIQSLAVKWLFLFLDSNCKKRSHGGLHRFRDWRRKKDPESSRF